MQRLTQSGCQDVVATSSQHGTTDFDRRVNGSLSELDCASTKQVRGVVLRSIVLRIRSNRNTIVNNDSHAIVVRDVDSSLNAGSIGVLPELQQLLLRKVESNLGVHDCQREDTGVVTNGLLDRFSSRRFAEHVSFASGTTRASKRDVGLMVLPCIPVIAIVISDGKNALHDADQSILALLVPVLRDLSRNLLHRVGPRVKVANEVLVTPSMHTAVNNASLRAAGRIRNSHVSSAVVVVGRAADHIVERNRIQVGTIRNHASDFTVALNRTAIDHSSTGGVLGRLPVHQENFFIKRVTKKSTRH